MANILFDKKVRSKFKTWKQIRFLYTKPYYEIETLSLKEKCYTFFYNMWLTGVITKGELDWSGRMMKLDLDMWQTMESLFEKDYNEYILLV